MYNVIAVYGTDSTVHVVIVLRYTPGMVSMGVTSSTSTHIHYIYTSMDIALDPLAWSSASSMCIDVSVIHVYIPLDHYTVGCTLDPLAWSSASNMCCVLVLYSLATACIHLGLHIH